MPNGSKKDGAARKWIVITSLIVLIISFAATLIWNSCPPVTIWSVITPAIFIAVGLIWSSHISVERRVLATLCIGIVVLCGYAALRSVLALYGSIPPIALVLLWVAGFTGVLGTSLVMARMFGLKAIQFSNPEPTPIVDLTVVALFITTLCSAAFTGAATAGGTTLSKLDTTLSKIETTLLKQHQDVVKLLEEIRDALK